jgi:hypothetical protein
MLLTAKNIGAGLAIIGLAGVKVSTKKNLYINF